MSMTKRAVLANGCFWCTEAVFKRLRGVVSVMPGYTGGTTPNPTYTEVSRGDTGHAEAILIEYDPSVISYNDLLIVFFATHDPTTLNRQGNDRGPQYRSVIFYGDDTERARAETMIQELSQAAAYPDPIVTEVVLFDVFYKAEDYHQNYYEQHPHQTYCQLVIAPKLEKLQKRFAQLVQ